MRETIKEMVDVMTAYKNLINVQSNCRGIEDDNFWVDCPDPGWNWAGFRYRIKPTEKKQEPIMPELGSKWKYREDHNIRILVVGIDMDKEMVWISNCDTPTPLVNFIFVWVKLDEN